MSWVIGVSRAGTLLQFGVVSNDGGIGAADVDSLRFQGIPCPDTTERMVYTGDLQSWRRVPADEYLHAFRISLPNGVGNVHAVFCRQLEDGTMAFVPALAFMRGFFRPNRLLLPAVFTPGNIDIHGFVDYSHTPPVAVIDQEREKYIDRREAEGRYEPLRWLHSSHSARRSCHSVHTSSLDGRLDLSLPEGQFRLVMHGRRIQSSLFVTKLTLISVTVSAHDCVSGCEATFLLHRMAGSERKVASLSSLSSVPIRQDGSVVMTDDEWEKVEPLLNSSRQHQLTRSRRALLDIFLLKLSSGSPWKSMTLTSGFDMTSLTTSFRRWQLDGRLASAVSALRILRFPT